MLDFLTLADRTAKPRESGLTHVLDKGLGPLQIEDLVAVALRGDTVLDFH